MQIPNMNYVVWETEGVGGSRGGFIPLNEDVKVGNMLIYIDSDDIDADLKKVKALGGVVLQEKKDIPSYHTVEFYHTTTTHIF